MEINPMTNIVMSIWLSSPMNIGETPPTTNPPNTSLDRSKKYPANFSLRTSFLFSAFSETFLLDSNSLISHSFS